MIKSFYIPASWAEMVKSPEVWKAEEEEDWPEQGEETEDKKGPPCTFHLASYIGHDLRQSVIIIRKQCYVQNTIRLK